MSHTISILHIESDPDDAMLFAKFLKQGAMSASEFKITQVDSLEKVMAFAPNTTFDLIVVDLFLPDSQGIHTFHVIKRNFESTPILVLTGLNDDKLAMEAMSHGAQDCLSKSDINPEGLARIIRYAIERHHLQSSLLALSFSDELTKLYNRRGFLTLAQQQLDLARRTKKGFYMLYIDLDHLKQINDTYGHVEGDNAIVNAANCIRRALRRTDIVGRIGGDEFAAVIIGSSKNSEQLIRTQLLDTVQGYNVTKQHPYELSFSIGMAYFNPSEEKTLDEIMEEADANLYTYKKARRA